MQQKKRHYKRLINKVSIEWKRGEEWTFTSNNSPGLVFRSHSTHRGCQWSLPLQWQMHMWWTIIITIWIRPMMKLPPFWHTGLCFLRRQSREIMMMMAISMRGGIGEVCHHWQWHAKSWGHYLAQVNPYGIHVESMESISNSMWNLWNQCWLETTANLLFHGHHGFNVEWSWNGQFHMEAIAISPGFHWIP